MTSYENILAETMNKFLKEHCTKELIDEAEKGNFPIKLWENLESMGVTTVSIPEEAGGTGFSKKEALKLLKISGEFSAPIPLAETFIANCILYEIGLPVSSVPMTVINPKDRKNIIFKSDEGCWKISGIAKSVPFARYADKIIVIGQSESDTSMISILNVNDLKVEPGQNLAGEARDTVYFNSVKVNNENVKSVKKESVYQIYCQYALTRIALMSGAMEHVLELTIQHANERKQFGKPIGKFQAIKQQLAVLASQVLSAGIAAEYAIESVNQKEDLEREVMIAKIQVGEAVKDAVRIAHQVHAAMGFTYEHPLHHSTRRLWSWRDEFGTEAEWSRQFGKIILSPSKESVWEIITS
jgi:acyl-CoA dehydrogenase